MKISYQWLKRYIDTDLELDEILTVLTDIGLEVDGVERFESVRGGLEGVVVGEVLTCTDHPDSDHLHLTEVAVGREEPLKIVCGAPNVAAGQKVLVATVGAVLYPTDAQEGFKIKKSRIRGADSFGMICAEDELGIGTGHEGIMVLPQEAVPGTPAAAFLGLESDTVIEIGLTPNRAGGFPESARQAGGAHPARYGGFRRRGIACGADCRGVSGGGPALCRRGDKRRPNRAFARLDAELSACHRAQSQE